MVDEQLKPLDDYYLWCDHRAWREAAEITQAARRYGLEAIDWCGGFCVPDGGHLHNTPRRAAGIVSSL
jgi:ribulose kinase